MRWFDARDVSSVVSREPTCRGARPPTCRAHATAAEVDPAGQRD